MFKIMFEIWKVGKFGGDRRGKGWVGDVMVGVVVVVVY